MTTPIGSRAPKIASSTRNGRRRQASTPEAIAATLTRPDSRRLPYSMIAWVSSGATAEPKHLGQSGQPRPEPVRRTPAPV